MGNNGEKRAAPLQDVGSTVPKVFATAAADDGFRQYAWLPILHHKIGLAISDRLQVGSATAELAIAVECV